MQNKILMTILGSIFAFVFSGCSDRPEETPLDTPGLYVGNISEAEGTSTTVATIFEVPVTVKRDNNDTVTVQYTVLEASLDIVEEVEGINVADILDSVDVSKHIARMGSTLDTPGADFVVTSGSLTFAPNDPETKTIPIKIIGDNLYERDEVFVVRLSNSTKANIVDNTGYVVIKNDDPIPVATLSLADSNESTALEEAKTPNVQLKVVLDSVSGVDAVMNITPNTESKDNNNSIGVTAAYRIDYLIKQNSAPIGASRELIVKAGETELLLDLELIDDGVHENTETISLAISALSDVNTSATPDLNFTITDNDTKPVGSLGNIPLNDTGLQATYTGTVASSADIPNCGGGDVELCKVEVNNLEAEFEQHMDANIGRDVTHNDDSNGKGGFDFTKLDSNGQPTTAVVTKGEDGLDVIPWECVKDNNTGLIWEVKLDGNEGLRAESRDIHWYDPNFDTNGGVAGEPGDFNCADSSYSSCSTAYYVADANASKLCGITGWRIPTIEELRSIVDYNKNNGVAYDTNYFAGDTRGISYVWSSTSYNLDPTQAWAVRFEYPVLEDPVDKSRSVGYAVRLVNDSQISIVQ